MLPLLPILFTIFVMASTALAQNADAQAEFRRGGERFAADLHRQLVHGSKRNTNLVLSPSSLRAALAMTRPGARGRTASELDRVLGLDPRQSGGGSQFRAIEDALRQRSHDGDLELFGFATDHRLWPDRSLRLVPAYPSLLKKEWDVTLESLDLQLNPEKARRRINQVIAKSTRGLIPEAIAPGAMRANARLMISSTTWLRSNWKHPFTQGVRPLKFLAPARTVSAAGMSLTKTLRYAENDDLQLVALPLADNELEFIVILPRSETGLTAFEKSLTGKMLRTRLALLKDSRRVVRLTLPRFSIEQRHDLVDHLRALGLSESTTEAADFGGISREEDLYLERIAQAATIRVNEHGLEAAAATTVELGARSLPNPDKIVTMRCDRPFFWTIRDRATKTILFTGRVVLPELLQEEPASGKKK